ncbi:MAG: hypothetical protein CMP38_03505 [Rickettsiales bacterium]|nr:hypothetical protein [Rickettsiales bacterium]OUW03796.1 MAG: hypothetical protein CBD16_03030 [Betaproteobacteria bacterium TMED156]|tara:strand:+ start:293 stop:970 length:678 start_codon:yes stop_codon:yes gene_type:complete
MIEYGSKINLTNSGLKGFDSFFSTKNCFVLCDGANSCVNGGIFAENLSKSVALNWSSKKKLFGNRKKYLYSFLLHEHKNYLSKKLDAASTLVALGIFDDNFEVFSVGDSYAEIYFRSNTKSWMKIFSMPRDINLNGDPWQLIGSDVFEKINYKNFNDLGTYCIFLLTDGAGNYLQDKNLLRILNTIGDKTPDSYDLNYLSTDLAFEAKLNGSNDDISVVTLFVTM